MPGDPGIDDENHFDRRLGLCIGSTKWMEGENVCRLIVVQQGEVVALEAGDSLSHLVCDHDVDLHAALRLIGRR